VAAAAHRGREPGAGHEAVRSRREHWSGRAGFVLANIASAVGLGSIWKFPYEVGANGGSAFVLFYVLGLMLVVLPLMLAELALGRRGRSDAIRSIIAVAAAARGSPRWGVIGAVGVGAGFLVLSFYSVIGGWALAYFLDTIRIGLPGADAQAAQARFDALLASPLALALHHLLFMSITAAIVARGVARGIEIAAGVLMPALMIMVAALAVYAAIAGDLGNALRFLLAFDSSRMTPQVALKALGLGFFSIGVGFCLLITYAAYAGKHVDLCQVAVVTLVSDTAISFMAGLAVFPLVFAEALDPSAGPGLVFTTRTLAFARMPFGTAAAAVFFALLVVAALGSAIALLELAVAPLRNALGWSRLRASLLCAAACWLVGLATVFSFNLWAGWAPLGGIPLFARSSVFELIDHLTSNLMLPAAGFGLAVFVGWAVPESLLAEELGFAGSKLAIVRRLLRYVVPAGIAAASIAPFF
jgi:NSS family neurotransmitter:Na+ symporter